MFPKVLGILRGLVPARHATPFVKARMHVGAIAHAKKDRAFRAVGKFVEFCGRMDHKRTWDNVDGLRWGAHGAATRKAEVDLRRLWMAVIWAHLPWLPASDGDVTAADRTQYLL